MKTPKTIEDYKLIAREISKNIDETYQLTRHFLRTDLYFLMWFGCERTDMEHQWLIDRCHEVQKEPDGYLDLWSRDHYKSSIITFGKTIQDILASHGESPLDEWNGKEPSIGFFSHTRPISKGFLRQIKREFENNIKLKFYFPDVIWENPGRDAPKWSEDDGLILKKKSNPKESTLEAWGLVEGQPTSKHFDILVFDDVVTLESVRSPEMRKKTLESWEMAINLGGGDDAKVRMIGTRYHFNDAYREIINRKAVKSRIYPGTIDGTFDGDPVLKTRDWMKKRLDTVGMYTFSTQILQNPIADSKQAFKKEWLRFHSGDDGKSCNIYLIIDPASEKKKSSDYTSAMVIGCAPDNNYRVLDIVRDRLNLKERGDMVFRLHRKWQPKGVGYEKYGMQADIEYIKERQKQENYYFDIVELGGQIPKIDRIKRIVPALEQGKWYYPESLHRTNYLGKVEDLIEIYINEEFLAFPVSVHDDMLDCQSRIVDPDLNVVFPRAKHDDENDRYRRRRPERITSPWAV